MQFSLSGIVTKDLSLASSLAKAKLVAGTSTVLVEALAYGCEIRPILMDYLPEEIDTPNLLGNLDGDAAYRVANEVESCLYA